MTTHSEKRRSRGEERSNDDGRRCVGVMGRSGDEGEGTMGRWDERRLSISALSPQVSASEKAYAPEARLL